MNEYENELLKLIDIKYFRNNPEYIKLWQEYFYNTNKDIKILFLMKYKKISTDYHWIYIELSEFFKKKNKPEISVFLLQDALRNGVYNPDMLNAELDKYQGIKAIDYNEACRFLNPVGFYVCGRIWNEIKVETFYSQDIYKEGISFEEYRLINYRFKKRVRNKNELVLWTIQDLFIKKQNVDHINFEDESFKRFKIYRETSIFLPIDNLAILYFNNFLINISNLLEKSPDLVKLYFIYKIYKFIMSSNILCKDLSGYYLDKDFKIRIKENYSFIILGEDDYNKIVLLFKNYVQVDIKEDFKYINFLRNIENIFKGYDMKRIMYKYQIYLYEKHI
ncbi:hypothetical protein P3W45_000251 [Vairimorpha bombi]